MGRAHVASAMLRAGSTVRDFTPARRAAPPLRSLSNKTLDATSGLRDDLYSILGQLEPVREAA
jgi:hypothetical protein